MLAVQQQRQQNPPLCFSEVAASRRPLHWKQFVLHRVGRSEPTSAALLQESDAPPASPVPGTRCTLQLFGTLLDITFLSHPPAHPCPLHGLKTQRGTEPAEQPKGAFMAEEGQSTMLTEG